MNEAQGSGGSERRVEMASGGVPDGRAGEYGRPAGYAGAGPGAILVLRHAVKSFGAV